MENPRKNPQNAWRSKKIITVAFISVALLYWVGLYLYMPTLPIYVQLKVNDAATVGIILSMFGLWQAVIRLPVGLVTGFLGLRKPFIVMSLIIMGLGAWVLGTATTASNLLVGRALTGVACGAWVLLIVSFAALFKQNEVIYATTILTFIGTLGRILASSLNGPINTMGHGYSLAFQLAAAIAWIGAGIALFLPETANLSDNRVTGSGILKILTRRDIVLPALMNAVLQHGDWATTFGFIPILAKHLGVSDPFVSILSTFYMIIVLIGNMIATPLLAHLGVRRLTLVIVLMMTLGISSISIVTTVPFLFISQAFIGLSVGIGYPLMMGSSIRWVEDKERTVAMGLHQTIYAIGMFTGPWISGSIVRHFGTSYMFAITGVAVLILGLFFAFFMTPIAEQYVDVIS